MFSSHKFTFCVGPLTVCMALQKLDSDSFSDQSKGRGKSVD